MFQHTTTNIPASVVGHFGGSKLSTAPSSVNESALGNTSNTNEDENAGNRGDGNPEPILESRR